MSYKLLFISDIHFGCKNNSEKYISIIKSFFLDTLKNVIEKENIKDVRILGDLIDNRNTINIRTLNTVLDVFRWYQNHKPSVKFKILLGNHDIYYHNRVDINSIEVLREFPNIEIIDNSVEEVINGKSIITFPWLVKDTEAYIKFNEVIHGEKVYDLCLGHFEINGFEVTPGIIHENGEQSIGKFKNFKRVFTGHFHLRNTSNQISYLGCPYPLNWGDYGDQKGIHIYDIDEGTTTFIENNDSPAFIKLTIDDLLQKNLAKLSKIKGNFIKLVVDKKYDPKIILKCLSIIENCEPIKLEVDNIFIEDFNGEDVGEVDLSRLNDPQVFLNEYIKNINLDNEYKDLDKIDFIKYVSELYGNIVNETE